MMQKMQQTLPIELAYTIGRNKTGKASGELVVCNW